MMFENANDKVSMRRNFNTANFFTVKFLYGELSLWRNFLQRKFLTAIFLYGEVSLRRCFFTAKFPTAKFPTGKFPTPKFPTGRFPSPKFPSAVAFIIMFFIVDSRHILFLVSVLYRIDKQFFNVNDVCSYKAPLHDF